MYQREFQQRLNNDIPHAVLLYGDNEYLKDLYLQYYKSKLDAKESLMTMYYDEYNFEQAKSYLAQSSLFGGTNLLALKSYKKLPKKELDTLVELTTKSSDNYLLHIHDGEDRIAKDFQKSYVEKKGGIWVRFFEPNMNESIGLLKDKAIKIGLDIDHYALTHLITMLNSNIALCSSELEKLAILDKTITSSDIDEQVYSTAPLSMEQLLIDLFAKKPITQTIAKLLELGEDEYAILRSTQFFVNQMFLFHAYIRINGKADSKEILGYKLPRHIEEQKAAIALRVKTSSLLKIYEHLLKSELLLKEPGNDQESLLYGSLAKLQSFL